MFTLVGTAFFAVCSGTAPGSGLPTLPKPPPPPPVPSVPKLPSLPKLPVPPPPSLPQVRPPSVPKPTIPSTPSAPAPKQPSVPGVVSTVTTTVDRALGVRIASPPAAPAPEAHRTAPSRSWVSIKGPARRRKTTVVFRLAHPGPLVFTLEELSPTCRKLASFRGRGRRGMNRISFHARVGKKPVEPGTYRIVARRPGGRIVMQRKLVIVRSGKPSRRQLAAARRANACLARAKVIAESRPLSGGGAPAGGNDTAARGSGGTSHTAAGPVPPPTDHATGGVLGVSTSLSPTSQKMPFLVLALVGFAIVLLALGALPRSALPLAAGAVVARRRLEIAMAGLATLLASVIAYLIV